MPCQAGCALQVRLKPYGIEMRGADEGPVSHVLALPALWVGLLYDAESKAAARDLTRDWTVPEMEDMRYQVCVHVCTLCHMSITTSDG